MRHSGNQTIQETSGLWGCRLTGLSFLQAQGASSISRGPIRQIYSCNCNLNFDFIWNNPHAASVPWLLVDEILHRSINVPTSNNERMPDWSFLFAMCTSFPCPWDALLHTCCYTMFQCFDKLAAQTTIFQAWKNAWELAWLVFHVKVMQWICVSWVSDLCWHLYFLDGSFEFWFEFHFNVNQSNEKLLNFK